MTAFMLATAVIPVPPPRELEPIASHENIATTIVAAVFVVCLTVALRVWRQEREPIGVFLLLGGCLAVFQEPMVDVLGNVWVRSRLTVFETFGRPMPVWAVLAYGIFWGFQPFVLYLVARRGFTLRAFRLGIAACFALNLLIELPILALQIYLYYGRQPFNVAGFPLHWLFINSAGMVAVAVAVNAYRSFFTRGRLPLVMLLPPVLVPAASLATGLPVMTALQTPAVPDSLLWIAAMLTGVIALVVIELGGRNLVSRAERPSQREVLIT